MPGYISARSIHRNEPTTTAVHIGMSGFQGGTKRAVGLHIFKRAQIGSDWLANSSGCSVFRRTFFLLKSECVLMFKCRLSRNMTQPTAVRYVRFLEIRLCAALVSKQCGVMACLPTLVWLCQ
jgi:hypothetical protein